MKEDRETASVQASCIIIENKTGRIISFIGGRGYTEENQYNYATKAKRSFGSTIKPLLVYAPAMEEGLLQPGTPIADIYKEIGPDNCVPDNYNSIYDY